MKNRWHIEDLIDLEYFLHCIAREEGEDIVPSAERDQDRELYVQRILPQLPVGQPRSRRAIIRLWLEARRQLENEEIGRQAMLPGEFFSQVWRLSAGGLLVGGMMTGSWLATSLLRYHGTEPVNVSLYVALLVIMQAGLAVISTIFLLLRWFRWRMQAGGFFYLFRFFFAALMGWLSKRLGERVSADRRAEFATALGLIKGRGTVYGSLFFWPIFTLAQTFGVGFNLGGLASTMLRVVGTDLAFGWQSTLQLSAKAVHQLVWVISLPWSWCLPPTITAPSLAQIEGSRMILKDGMYRLSTTDLVAWWPFLLLALGFYGLVPRLALLAVGVVAKRRALGRLKFTDSACDRLLQRLERPAVRLDGAVTPAALADQVAVAEGGSSEAGMSSSLRAQTLLRGVALIPDDVFADCSLDRLRPLVQQVFGVEVDSSFRIGLGLAANQHVLGQLAGEGTKGQDRSIFILQEAWHPPIRETLTFLQELRTRLGSHGKIVVGLIGKPTSGTIFTPVEPLDWQVWRRKIATLADPHLRLERLVVNNEDHDS